MFLLSETVGRNGTGEIRSLIANLQCREVECVLGREMCRRKKVSSIFRIFREKSCFRGPRWQRDPSVIFWLKNIHCPSAGLTGTQWPCAFPELCIHFCGLCFNGGLSGLLHIVPVVSHTNWERQASNSRGWRFEQSVPPAAGFCADVCASVHCSLVSLFRLCSASGGKEYNCSSQRTHTLYT